MQYIHTHIVLKCMSDMRAPCALTSQPAQTRAVMRKHLFISTNWSPTHVPALLPWFLCTRVVTYRNICTVYTHMLCSYLWTSKDKDIYIYIVHTRIFLYLYVYLHIHVHIYVYIHIYMNRCVYTHYGTHLFTSGPAKTLRRASLQVHRSQEKRA